MDKAKQAKDETRIAEAKEEAIMLATKYIQEYMDKRYVQNLEVETSSTKPEEKFKVAENGDFLYSISGVELPKLLAEKLPALVGDYVASKLNGTTEGTFNYSVDGRELTIQDKSTDEAIVTGTIQDNGTITWNEKISTATSTATSTSTSTSTATATATPEVEKNSVEGLAKSGKIKAGDKINYNPGNATTNNISLPTGTSLNGVINASDSSDWVVLDVNETTGEVKIIPKNFSNSTLTIRGLNGYNNFLNALDMVAGIYLNPSYAQSARSINLKDILKREGRTLKRYPKGPYTKNSRYGIDSNLNITDAGFGNMTSTTFKTTAEEAKFDTFFVNKMFNINGFWVATRVIGLSETNSNEVIVECKPLFCDGVVADSFVPFYFLSGSPTRNFEEGYTWERVLPVVVLKLDAHLKKTVVEPVIETIPATGTATTPTENIVSEGDEFWEFE